MAQDRPLQILAAVEAVALQDILDPAVEPPNHAVGLRSHRRRQAVLDAEIVAEAVELVVAGGGGATVQTEEPVGKLPAIVGQHPVDPHRRGAVEVARGKRRALAAVLTG